MKFFSKLFPEGEAQGSPEQPDETAAQPNTRRDAQPVGPEGAQAAATKPPDRPPPKSRPVAPRPPPDAIPDSRRRDFATPTWHPAEGAQRVSSPVRQVPEVSVRPRPATPATNAGEGVDKGGDRGSSPRLPPLPEPRRGETPTLESLRAGAPAQARPARELMFQLGIGRTARGWALAARSALLPLLEGARRLELRELIAALERFEAALKRAATGAGAAIDAEATGPLQAAYRALGPLLPDAFPAESHADTRRKLLFEAALMRAPGMQKRVLAKLQAAGIASVEPLSRMTADALAALAGIDAELAQALILRAQQFERERQYQDLGDMQAQAERRLRTLSQRLEAQNQEFERAEREEALERKRQARQGREAALLELHQLLLELGELELADELARYPLSGKLQAIERYLVRRP